MESEHPLYRRFRGGSNPPRCNMQDSKLNTLPTIPTPKWTTYTDCSPQRFSDPSFYASNYWFRHKGFPIQASLPVTIDLKSSLAILIPNTAVVVFWKYPVGGRCSTKHLLGQSETSQEQKRCVTMMSFVLAWTVFLYCSHLYAHKATEMDPK